MLEAERQCGESYFIELSHLWLREAGSLWWPVGRPWGNLIPWSHSPFFSLWSLLVLIDNLGHWAGKWIEEHLGFLGILKSVTQVSQMFSVKVPIRILGCVDHICSLFRLLIFWPFKKWKPLLIYSLCQNRQLAKFDWPLLWTEGFVLGGKGSVLENQPILLYNFTVIFFFSLLCHFQDTYANPFHCISCVSYTHFCIF